MAYIRVHLTTLACDRTPIPPGVSLADPTVLRDMVWLPEGYYPGIETKGYGYWPEVNGSPALSRFQRYGDELSLTANPADFTVTSVFEVLDWSPEEIAAAHEQDFRALQDRIEQQVLPLENAAARQLCYAGDSPMQQALSYRGTPTQAGADAEMLFLWRAQLRDHLVAQLELVRAAIFAGEAYPDDEAIFAGAPAAPVRVPAEEVPPVDAPETPVETDPPPAGQEPT